MQLTYLGQSFSVESTSPRLTPVAGPLTRTLLSSSDVNFQPERGAALVKIACD